MVVFFRDTCNGGDLIFLKSCMQSTYSSQTVHTNVCTCKPFPASECFEYAALESNVYFLLQFFSLFITQAHSPIGNIKTHVVYPIYSALGVYHIAQSETFAQNFYL